MRHPGERGSNSGSSTVFLDLLAVAFIVLKLLGYINWSWLWVLSPVWLPLVVAVGLILILKLYEKIHWAVRRRQWRKKRDKD